MNRIINFFNNVIFRKIVMIFVVGLISRSVVNLVFDINVFKDYTNYISLVYYVFMACCSEVVYELSTISFNVFNIFNIKLVRNAIKMFFEDSFMVGNKMISGTLFDGFKTNLNDSGKDSFVYNQGLSFLTDQKMCLTSILNIYMISSYIVKIKLK